MKRVTCKSGLEGWRDRLQNVYDSFTEFKSYSDMYGLAQRLGFPSAKTAWRVNPVVEGSVDPGDFRRVGPVKNKKQCPACKRHVPSCVCQPIGDPQGA